MSDKGYLFEAREVCVQFGALRAVDGVSLGVSQGAIVGLIGPNGAGKSTLFNSLAGEIRPSSGAIIFKGSDIVDKTPEQRAHLGIARTYQIPQTFGDMSVLENVLVGAFLRDPSLSAATKRAAAVLDFVEFEGRAQERAGNLGTPNRKRLEIARALATEPKVLLLDEALAGLTEAEVKRAILLLKKINEQGIALVIVEHVLEVINELAKEVLVLDQGRMIARGSPDQVMCNDDVRKAYFGA